MADALQLTVSARADSLSLIRLLVGSVASRLDMTLDEMDDLQLAVEELCLPLLGETSHNEGRLHVHVGWDDDAINVRCELDVDASRPLPTESRLPEELSQAILNALVDEHGHDSANGLSTAWLRKRRRDATIDS